MEIKSNSGGMKVAVDNYDILNNRLNLVREDLVNIITDIDDYWIGRSGDSFKYICWYFKILLDTGCSELYKLRCEVNDAKEAMNYNDCSLSNKIQNKE
ncbi:hypothetical protein HMPREF0491_01840 [Lachnospiraceae oral taxon 107 str. F0167]|nr:hypothetical protein HMPREF0491_01840 [Lachnospiraceae oral taxon 107 str. F0167]